MRFMLLQNYGEVESDCAPMYEWTPEDIKAHIDFQIALNQELSESGELLDAQAIEVRQVMGTPGGADPAGGRRPDHSRDRRRVPGPRDDDGAADQPRQAAHPGIRCAVLAACRRRGADGQNAVGAARDLPDF